MNFVFFGVKKSGISVLLESVENGAGVKKMTNIKYDPTFILDSFSIFFLKKKSRWLSCASHCAASEYLYVIHIFEINIKIYLDLCKIFSRIF